MKSSMSMPQATSQRAARKKLKAAERVQEAADARRRRCAMAAEEAKNAVEIFDGQVPSFLIDDDKYKALKAKRQEAMSD